MNIDTNTKLIDEFFNHIIDDLFPSFIISKNKKIDVELNIIKQSLFDLKDEMKKLPNLNSDIYLWNDSFKTEFKKQIKAISSYIQHKIEKTNFMYELNPILNELKNLSEETAIPIVLKTLNEYTEKLNHVEIISKKLPFNGLTFIKEKLLNKIRPKATSNLTEDTWEQLAKESLNKLFIDFEFKSIIIMGKHPWVEIYSWSTDTYKAIKDAQENIGLSQKSAGINGTLNLCYNPYGLEYKEAYGTALLHEYSNSINLTQQPYNLQKCTWQHEYTHILDNRSNIKYLKDIKLYSERDEYSCMSVTELSRTLHNRNLDKSEDYNTQQAQIWTSEVMAMIINGKNDYEFKIYQKNAENKFLNEISQYLIISLLPKQEITWMKLSTDEQQKILNHPYILDFTKFISKNLYMKSHQFLEINTDNYNEDFSIIKKHITNIAPTICQLVKLEQNLFIQEAIETIETNRLQLTKDLNIYLNKHSYSFDGHRTYFPTSNSIKNASNKSLSSHNNYWIMPVEILARASENLQQPLLIGTSNFHQNFDGYSNNYLVPQLNKDERIILINCIHSMAKSIGLEVFLHPEDVKAVEKQLNFIEEHDFESINIENLTSYSTATGDEATSKIILNLAKLRSNYYVKIKNNK